MKRALSLVAALALGACATAAPAPAPSAYQLKPDWRGPCARAELVDVNLGHTPETFVRACYCQVRGSEPSASELSRWTAKIRKDERLRRVDLVLAVGREAGRALKLAYSDPWVAHPELGVPTGAKKHKRDMGAVVMFFFSCPGGTNCGMDWANNHAPGMDRPSPLLAWREPSGIYDAKNPGFWRRELRDARAAGLQFILPNVYGPDIAEGKLATLTEALKAGNGGVKIGLFDDTWAWGEKWFGPYWEQKPDLANPELASQKLYESKWKPFFKAVPREHWYLVDGKPLIYFYNTNKLQPINRSAQTFKRMKARFRADFGVEPFLCLDSAFYRDPDANLVSGGKFNWSPLLYPEGVPGLSRINIKKRILAHAMVRWDAVGRDRPGQPSSPSDKLFKGDAVLRNVLKASEDVDFLVFATWNDLGEGTGVNRCYDYWFKGQWLAPDHFIRILREAQFGQ